MSQDLNRPIQNPSPIDSSPAIEGSGQEVPKGKPFAAYMEPNQTQSVTPASTTSPMDLARPTTPLTTQPTFDSIKGQMDMTSSSLGDLNNKLNTPNLKLKPSQKYLLRNKLTEANTQIRDVAAKTGVEVGPPVSPLSRNNPVAKFLSLVTDGENQINQTQAMLTKMTQDNSSLKPTDLMLMQVKLTKAQQELEYSSALLSKAVDDIKVLFNVQI